MAEQSLPPGMVLPSLIHGGPGRAGGGEELGGLRGLTFYMQRTALQGFKGAIEASFGGFSKFQDALTAAALGTFGSGWAWLSADKGGKLIVESTPNQDNPLARGNRPLLGVDVWEHAYYLKYQNRRPDYLAAWWNVVNWAEVARRFEAAR